MLHDIVAQQERQLQGRAGQIDRLKNRGTLSDLAVTDLEKRATLQVSRLATDKATLLTTTEQQAAQLDHLRGRTWAGRKLRSMRTGLAIIGGIYTAFVMVRLVVAF